MAIPLEGTFEYVAVIPDHPAASFSCDARLRPLGNDSQGTTSSRLVGPTPRLHVEDAGPAPNPGPRAPATQRSRLRLIAANKLSASVAEASFVLDQGVISALRPGDLLHMVRTGCGSIGVSAIRSDQLIFAAGAITAVPLGCDLKARIPYELVREAEAVFQVRYDLFQLREYPVEILVSGMKPILLWGFAESGSFKVWVVHGKYPGEPGHDACASVVRKGQCGFAYAKNSALLLDSDPLEMVR